MEPASPGGPGHARRRTPTRALALAAVLLLLALALFAAWRALPRAAEALLTRAARGTPAEPLELRVEHLDTGRMVLRDLRIGPGAALRIARLELHYSPTGLRRGRIDRAEIHDLVWTGELGSGAGAQATGGPALGAIPEAWRWSGRFPLASLALVSGRIELASLPPLGLSGELTESDGRVAFEAQLSAADGSLRVEIAGSHSLPEAAGEARVRLVPLEFAAGGLQPRALLPEAPAASRVAGRLALDGALRWSPNGIDAPFDLRADGFSFQFGELRVEGLDTTLHFERPWPLTTPPHQRIRVARVLAGTRFSEGLLLFQLGDDGRITIEELTARALGGGIRTRGVIDARAEHQRLTWEVEADLGLLLASLDLEGLSGEGRIRGELPVELGRESPVVRGGALRADPGGGRIRYRPGPGASFTLPQAAGVDLAALFADFHYETLRATLDGDMNDVVLGLQLRGSNPAFYDGHPVEFNLRLEYQPRALLRSLALVTQFTHGLAAELAAGDSP